ncbi:hypothetical protein [Methanolobus sp. ZRKC5]
MTNNSVCTQEELYRTIIENAIDGYLYRNYSAWHDLPIGTDFIEIEMSAH